MSKLIIMNDKKLTKDLKRMGAALKGHREALGFTPQQLSLKCGCSVSTIYRMERGDTGTTFINYIKVCSALKYIPVL
jgi:hypothetical protein